MLMVAININGIPVDYLVEQHCVATNLYPNGCRIFWFGLLRTRSESKE